MTSATQTFDDMQDAPSKIANVSLRRRTGARRADALQNICIANSAQFRQELTAPDPRHRKGLQQLRRIVDCVLKLDLETTLFLTKDTSSDSQRANIQHHFRRRYEGIHPVSDWLDKELSAKQASGIDVDGDDDYDTLGELTERQLGSILRETNAAKFWPRMLLGRIAELNEQHIVHSRMREDLAGAFELSLGMLLEQAPETQGEYLSLVVANLQSAELRLAKVVERAVVLRDRVRAAVAADEEPTLLDQEMLDALRRRLTALEEAHYFEAWTLVKDKDSRLGGVENQRLTDPEDVWRPRDEEPQAQETQVVVAETQGASMAALMGLSMAVTLLAMLPACVGFYRLEDARGGWFDADFWALVASAVLQLLGLLVQLVAPLASPDKFRSALPAEAKHLVWGFSVVVCLCTVAAMVLYGCVSLLWSAMVGFVAQAFLGVIQLVLVFSR
ncbi:hypothetical protein GGTG_08883, partial [Gaeumannomyces tritici R3-111a-1]